MKTAPLQDGKTLSLTVNRVLRSTRCNFVGTERDALEVSNFASFL